MARWVQFSFYKYLIFPDKLFWWCVVIVGSYCCGQSVQKSAFFSVAEKSMAWWKAHMQSNLLYILHIWWPLTTKGLCEVHKWTTIVRKTRCTWEKYWILSLSEYEYYINGNWSRYVVVWEWHCLHSALGWLFKSQFACCVLWDIPFLTWEKIKENTPNLQSKLDIHKFV
jgi:hypothetical protein